jgi:hypothetical protein
MEWNAGRRNDGWGRRAGGEKDGEDERTRGWLFMVSKGSMMETLALDQVSLVMNQRKPFQWIRTISSIFPLVSIS